MKNLKVLGWKQWMYRLQTCLGLYWKGERAWAKEWTEAFLLWGWYVQFVLILEWSLSGSYGVLEVNTGLKYAVLWETNVCFKGVMIQNFLNHLNNFDSIWNKWGKWFLYSRKGFGQLVFLFTDKGCPWFSFISPAEGITC